MIEAEDYRLTAKCPNNYFTKSGLCEKYVVNLLVIENPPPPPLLSPFGKFLRNVPFFVVNVSNTFSGFAEFIEIKERSVAIANI